MAGSFTNSNSAQQLLTVAQQKARHPVREQFDVLTRPLDNQQLTGHREALRKLVSQDTVDESKRRRMCYEIGQRVIESSKVMSSPNFTVTTAKDLQWMAELYDKYFFHGNCLAIAQQDGIRFRWSKRMTSNGGKTVRTTSPAKDGSLQTCYEIVLSATLLFQTFGDLRRPIRVTGLLCTNRLQAMQRILEHELIHLVEMLVWDDSCCAAPRFQSIAGRLFGHTEHKHDLVTQRERAASKFNVRIGTRVSFLHEGKKYTGTVNRITRRATVLVRDSKGQLYDDGHRYSKYYVPISHLRPADA